MRASVVLIACSLSVAAAVLFVVARQDTEVAPTPASMETRPRVTAPRPLLSQADPHAASRPAPANVIASRPVIDRYLSDDRLFETFDQLRHSAAGDDLWVALRIVNDCYYSWRDAYLVGAVLAGRPFNHFEKTGPGTRAGADSGELGSLRVTQVIATPAQVDAARELRRRCDGFQSMTLSAFRTSRAEIEVRLPRLGDAVGLAEAVADHRAPATPYRLRTILASQDPIALILLDQALGERWQRYTGKPVVPAISGFFSAPTAAMRLLTCDLEADCSATSFTALLGCIDDAEGCGLDVHNQSMRLETPSIQQLIEDTRAAYLHAIVTGDYAVWGL